MVAYELRFGSATAGQLPTVIGRSQPGTDIACWLIGVQRHRTSEKSTDLQLTARTCL
jgi:hypothetical protein